MNRALVANSRFVSLDGWNGKQNEKELVPEVFYYILNFRSKAGKIVTISGNVSIIK